LPPSPSPEDEEAFTERPEPDWFTKTLLDNKGEAVKNDSPDGEAVRARIGIPPAAPMPRIRFNLKTKVAAVRCNKKSFAPKQFDGYIGSGRNQAHHTHFLASARGVVWCWRCGKVATVKPIGLCKPCTGVPNRFGKATLERLRKGKPPFHMKEWPPGDNTNHRQLVIACPNTWDQVVTASAVGLGRTT
jgi:hypothetical protein